MYISHSAFRINFAEQFGLMIFIIPVYVDDTHKVTNHDILETGADGRTAARNLKLTLDILGHFVCYNISIFLNAICARNECL